MEFVDDAVKKKKPRKRKTVAKKTDVVESTVVEQKPAVEQVVEPVVEPAVVSEPKIFSSGVVLVLALLVAILFYNQLLLFDLATFVGAPSILKNVATVIPGNSLTLSDGEKTTYGPALLAAGESPVIPSYKTKFKEFPTVSAKQKKPKTNDAVQDAVNAIIPTGTPEYGKEIGVSFDDPVNSMNRLGQIENSLTLKPEQEKRWNKIINSFTCDFCCGSPQSPTIISRCGCAHAAAWRGVAKFLIAKYDIKVTDEQIMGEMTKWKALWYPGPMVTRFLQEQASGTTGGKINVDSLPQMVGGC